MKLPDVFTEALDSKLMGFIGVLISSATAFYHQRAAAATGVSAQVTQAVLDNPVSWFWMVFLTLQILRLLRTWFRDERRYWRKRKGKGDDDPTTMSELRHMDGRPL